MSIESKGTASITACQAMFPVLVGPNPQLAALSRERRWYQRAWTPLVVIWALLLQRLQADHSCDAVVSRVLEGAADHLDQRHARPLSQRLHSESSSAFCQARARLPLAFLIHLLRHTAEQGLAWLGPGGGWVGHPVALLDGSSLLLRPSPALRGVYAAHQNQFGPTYWLGMRVLVAFCLTTGALLAVHEGSIALSEQALVLGLLAQLPANTVCVADRNFGVFSVVQAARHYRQHVVVRLTRRQAQAIFGRPLRQPGDWFVHWACGPDAQTHPGLDARPIAGRFVCVTVRRAGRPPLDLFLFTTLTDAERYPVRALLALYGRRWHVELDLRYVKSTLDLDRLAATTPDMVRKELYAGLLAYNLIRSYMTQAACQADRSPLGLSFSQCWRRIAAHWAGCRLGETAAQRAERTQRLLTRLARCRLPQRPPFRLEPRAVRRRPAVYPNLKGSRAAARRQTLIKLWEGAKS